MTTDTHSYAGSLAPATAPSALALASANADPSIWTDPTACADAGRIAHDDAVATGARFWDIARSAELHAVALSPWRA